MPDRAALLVVIMISACSSGDSSVVEIHRATACALSTVPFTISDVAIDGGELVADIATSGSCTAPRFSVCWDGIVEDTFPAQVDLVVTYQPSGGTCEAPRTDQVRVDPGVLRDAGPIVINLLDEEGFNANTTRVDYP